MKKIYILFIVLVLFSACKKDDNFNAENVKAPKNYTLFNKQEITFDINAGTNKFNKSDKNAFLLDVSKEADYEKYFPKFYILDFGGNFNKYKTDKEKQPALKFLYEGTDLNDAYKIIAIYFNNKDEMLNRSSFRNYCFPESEFFGSGKYIDEIKGCLNDYQIDSIIYNNKNLALLKARNMILYALENNLKNEDDKIKADAHLMIAISYLAQDELYQLNNIKKHAALWKELGGLNVEIFNSKINKELTALLTYVAYNENTGVEEILRDSIDKGFINQVLSKGGIYNYLNDNDYIPVAVTLRGENKFAVNPFFVKYDNLQDTANIMRELVPAKEENTLSTYNFQNNYDNLYDNPVYILPLNGVVYTVIMKDDKPLKVEFRNPAYYDTSYGEITSILKDGFLPLILSEYSYDYIQKDYIVYKNGKANVVWNGNIRDQQPDVNKLFKLMHSVNCLEDKSDKMEYLCGHRESMIMAQYLYKNRCAGKKDCIIKSDELLEALNNGRM